MFRKNVNWVDWLTSNVFAFGRIDQPPYTKTMSFKRDGTVQFGLDHSPNESYWHIENGELSVLDTSRNPTTIFKLPVENVDRLVGDFLADNSIQHELRVVSNGDAMLDVADKLRQHTDDSVERLQRELLATTLAKPRNARQRIRVAFVLNAIETLDAQLPLIKAAIRDSRFEVRVLTFDRIFRGDIQEGTKVRLDKVLLSEKIYVVEASGNAKIDIQRLRDWQPDFLFRQSEWDQDFPSELSADNLYWTRIAHNSYVINENLTFNPNGNLPFFMLEYYEKVWRYFVSNDLTDEDRSLLAKTFISEDVFKTVGSVKAMRIKQLTPQWPVNTKKKKIIWMPHHSIGNRWFAFGTFDKTYRVIFDWARKHPEYSIILNPHPSLKKVIENGDGDISSADYEAFLTKWEQLENTEYFVGKSSYAAVAAADVVLSDGISVLYEAQIIGKPIVYIENEGHVPFTQFGEQLMAGVHRYQTIENALEAVERFTMMDDNLLSIQKENVRPWLAVEHPEQVILQEMVNEISAVSTKTI
jgi:hypothetical protein